jgi:hypothetical protein
MSKKTHAVEGFSAIFSSTAKTHCGRAIKQVTVVTKRSQLTCKQCLQAVNNKWTWRDENPNY